MHPPGPFTRDRIGLGLHFRVHDETPRDARIVRGTTTTNTGLLRARSARLPTTRLRRKDTGGGRPRLPTTGLARYITGLEFSQ